MNYTSYLNFQSDEYSEFSNTCSDIDSQPRTPGSALGNDEFPSDAPKYDLDEGIFKLPGEPPKTPGRDENVAKRTRSKISYTETPIESIQTPLPLDFVPETDESNVDLDESWQEFLKEFQMPLRELIIPFCCLSESLF